MVSAKIVILKSAEIVLLILNTVISVFQVMDSTMVHVLYVKMKIAMNAILVLIVAIFAILVMVPSMKSVLNATLRTVVYVMVM